MTAAHPKQQSRLNAALAALWAGFTQPSLFALCTIAIMSVATVVAAFILVTPEKLSGPFGAYLVTTSEDVEGAATKNAYILVDPRKPITITPHLYVVGNSLIAQAFADGPKLDKALEADTGKTWQTYFMTTGSQGPLDEAALVDYATMHQPGVVVLPINFDRFDDDVKEMMKFYRMGRLGFRSDLADNQVKHILKQRPRRKTGVFIVDNRFFFLRNASIMGLRFLTQQPAEQKIDAFVFRPVAKKLVTYKRDIVGSLRENYQHPELATALLESTAQTIRERGSRMVFFQVPISKILLDNPADYQRYLTHLAKSEELAKRLGGVYCKPPGDAVLPTNLFSDYYHLANPVWQDKMRKILARCVADVQREGASS
jgi:hypothetical protein